MHSFWVVEQSQDALIAAAKQLHIQLARNNIADVLDGRVSLFNAISMVVDGGPVTWEQAIVLGLNETRRLGYPCEYFVLTNDEVRWHVDTSFTEVPDEDIVIPDRGARVVGGVSAELHSVLAEYHPAVLGFPWLGADLRFAGATACATEWKEQRVVPLTVMEASVGVYHASIVHELFPLVRSKHLNTAAALTASAWYNMVLPFMFKSHAIRLNSIGYSRAPDSSVARQVRIPSADLTSGCGLFTPSLWRTMVYRGIPEFWLIEKMFL